jgi:hypothetical protein
VHFKNNTNVDILWPNDLGFLNSILLDSNQKKCFYYCLFKNRPFNEELSEKAYSFYEKIKKTTYISKKELECIFLAYNGAIKMTDHPIIAIEHNGRIYIINETHSGSLYPL